MTPQDPVEFLFRLKTEKPLTWKKVLKENDYVEFIGVVAKKLLGGEPAQKLWDAILASTPTKPSEGKRGRPEAVDDHDEIERLHKAGMATSEIARQLGVSRPTVYKCFRQLGLPTKTQQRQTKKH